MNSNTEEISLEPEDNCEEEPPRKAAQQSKSSLNFNKYATQKTAIQGCLDFVIFKRNVADLKDVFSVDHDKNMGHEINCMFMYLLVASVALHIVTWACMVKLMVVDISKQENSNKANKLNYIVTVLLFTITILNVILEILDESKQDK